MCFHKKNFNNNFWPPCIDKIEVLCSCREPYTQTIIIDNTLAVTTILRNMPTPTIHKCVIVQQSLSFFYS